MWQKMLPPLHEGMFFFMFYGPKYNTSHLHMWFVWTVGKQMKKTSPLVNQDQKQCSLGRLILTHSGMACIPWIYFWLKPHSVAMKLMTFSIALFGTLGVQPPLLLLKNHHGHWQNIIHWTMSMLVVNSCQESRILPGVVFFEIPSCFHHFY